MPVKITYFGHSSFQLEAQGASVMIDPCNAQVIEGRQRLIPSALDTETVRGVDLVLVTHEHAGHFDSQAIKRIVERTNATVVGPVQAIGKLDINPRLMMQIKAGQEFSARGVRVKVAKAVHPQSQCPVGYIVQMGGLSVYHAGDTYNYTGIEANSATVALLPIGGTYTMDDNDAASVCRLAKFKYAIPMHYGTHDNLEQGADEFVRRLGETTKPVVLKPGQAANINPQ